MNQEREGETLRYSLLNILILLNKIYFSPRIPISLAFINISFRCNKMIAEIEQKIRKFEADTSKIIAEIEEKTRSGVAKIDAQSELDAQEIISETKMIRASLMADGRAHYNKLFSESDAYIIKKDGQAKEKVAKFTAEEIKVKGKAESELVKNLASRRHFDEEMAKLGVLQDLSQNDHLSIYGDHKDNLLAQLARFQILGAKG